MGTSTPPWEVVGLVVRAAWPACAMAAIFVGVAGFAYRAHRGLEPAADVDTINVKCQVERARVAPPSDILILGDSSALMDIDPAQLGRALGGLRVESLGTPGWVGPAGFASLLRTYAAHARTMGQLILALHGTSLGLEESVFVDRGYEQAVLNGRAPKVSFLVGARREISTDILGRAVDLALPGRYGALYGSPRDLERVMREGHGSFVDPNVYAPEETPPAFRFRLSSAVAERMGALRETIAQVRPIHVWLTITPIPFSVTDNQTRATRDAIARELIVALGLSSTALLATPPDLPDGDFATMTHLRLDGRTAYTAALAGILAQQGPSLRGE